MIIIKKRILLNCLILFCVCYTTYALIKNNYKDEQVVALPINEKVIVIDARTWWRRWGCSIY